MTIEQQAAKVRKVKRAESGMIIDPVTLPLTSTVADAKMAMKEYGIGGIPIVDENKILKGIVTNRDLRFEKNTSRAIVEVMTKDNLITVAEGTSLEQAEVVLQGHKIEKLPVTVKTRLGWDDNSKIIVDLAERLQDVGIAALTVHGRTRCQLYKGEADWTLIGEIKKNPRMRIPIIGNGDIVSDIGAAEAFEKYGVDGIMIGRATYGRPWIFKEIKHFLATGEHMPELTLSEKCALAKRHLIKSVEVKGERVGVLEMRRHLSSYFKALPNFKEIRMKLVTENDYRVVLELIDMIQERYSSSDKL
jgi:CBS domain-containing protein